VSLVTVWLTGAFPSVQKYPIQKKHRQAAFLRTVPHLRIRTPFNSFLARFRSSCLSFVHKYFSETHWKGGVFVQVQPPIITSSDCEGAGEVFTISSNAPPSASEQSVELGTTPNCPPFFRAPKYLTVSSQLHLEALAAELRNVWALSPIFRADKSDSPRHLAEFYMLEVEMSYASSLRLLTGFVEHLIRSLAEDLMATPAYHELLLATRASNEKTREEKVAEIAERWHRLLGDRWRNASYSYCMKRLREAANADPKLFYCQPGLGTGFQLEHEKWIVQNVGQNQPIFVTHYPKAIKPFYVAPSLLATDYVRHPDYQSTDSPGEHFEESETGEDAVACFDLLMPFGIGEIAGGSLREHRLENLIQNMREDGMLKPRATQPSSHKVDEASAPATDGENAYPFLQPGESLGALKWYADLRRYATIPHGGFGIGWDRLIAYLTGVQNLKDTVPFPRSFGRADC
jgi:asparaginyl-tRNA synthetase